MNNKTISIVLIVLGVIAILFFLSTDLLGLGGHVGIGWKQMVGMAFGVTLIATGWWLSRRSPK